MFGDFRRDVIGNVFDEPCPGLFAFMKFGAAVGTAVRPMFELVCNDGRRASDTFVTGRFLR